MKELKRIRLANRLWLINDGQGMGGYGNPDDHYLRNWVITEGNKTPEGYKGYMSIDYALALDYVPESAKQIIRKTLGI